MSISTDQITGSNFSYQHYTFKRFLEDMVEFGRTHIELWGIAPHCHVPEVGFADIRRMRKQLTAFNLQVACVTPEQVVYPVNLASPDDRMRESSIAMFKRAADICLELASPLLLLTAGRGAEDQARGDAWGRAEESIAEVAGYAGLLGVDCVLEPLQRVESNLVGTAAELNTMIREIDATNLFVILDTVSMAVAGDTIEDYSRLFGPTIRHVHLVDGQPAGHLAWGDGHLPLSEYLGALDSASYPHFMTFELFGDGSYALDPHSALHQCFGAFDAALSAR